MFLRKWLVRVLLDFNLSLEDIAGSTSDSSRSDGNDGKRAHSTLSKLSEYERCISYG